MSRQRPFPTSRRANPPPVAYNNFNDERLDTTLPLTINRQPSQSSRPITPSSSTGSMSVRASPARPARSERRPRHASQYSVSSISSRNMDFDNASVMSGSDTLAGPGPSSRTQGLDRGQQQDAQSPPPSAALKSVLNAFQQAGAQRKRAMTNGTVDWEKDRQRELDEEAQRQKRIRDKVPGRRANGKTKAVGNIDCM